MSHEEMNDTRSYFGYSNLGSVVPLAMYNVYLSTTMIENPRKNIVA